MKKILLLVAIMLCCATAIFAQNNKISYQAVVRDTANRLVANKTVTVTVNIFNGDAQTAAYTETHTNVQTNYNGLFSLQMGNGTNQSGDWNAIQWKNARVTTAVSLDGTELATLNMPLTAVPYALYADYAEEINPDATVVTDIYDKLGTKADTGSVYTREIINNKLDTKANAADVYTKTVIDDKLGAKADTSKVYTRIIIDNKLDAKANTADLANVATTGSYNDLSDVPTNLVQDANYHHTDHNFKDADSVKLAGIASGAEVNVQADWNETNENSDAFIKNKPEIPAAQVQANWNQTNENAVDYIKYKPTLANVATSGSYNDLTNKPTIPAAQVNSDWNATSGVSKIHNKPSITDSIRAYMDTCTAVIKNNDLCTSIGTCDNVALRYESNTFTQDNTFSGTISVPSNTTTFPTPSGKDYSNRADSSYAVSVRDLLAVFDSLNRRINSVYDSLQRLNDELTAVKSTIPPVTSAPTVSNVTSASMNVKANATSAGFTITSYEFCISTNGNMSGATCQTVQASDADNYIFTGLNPNTNYYVQYSATNFAGTTTSASVLQRTPAHAPTATVNTPTSVPTGFKVEVTGIDPKEKTDATTVQVCYVLKGSGDCPEKESADYAECKTVDATGVTDTTISVTGLTPSTAYCAIVKVSNGDSTTIYGPWSVTTGADVTMTVSQTGGDTISLCGDPSVNVIYTATPSDGGSYTYSWSGSPASTSDNTATYSYTSASTYNVTVTAMHTTEGYTVTATASTTVVNSGGTAVSFDLCEWDGVVTMKSVSGTPNHIEWGDNRISDGTISTSPSHDYTTTLATGPHEVTITASNSDGCIFSRTMTVNVLGVADRTVNPCSVGSHVAQTGSSYMGNGFGGANHGLETVNGEGKITSVTDYDGNAYPVVQIGNQCWLAENLRVSHSPKTGSNIVVNDAVNNSGSKMAVWYNNNEQSTYEAKRYGLLYNWCAAMDTARPSSGSYTYVEVATAGNTDYYSTFTSSNNHQGVCPTGWHVPTDAEWNAMEQVVNVDAVSGTSTTWRGSHAGKLSTGCDWSSSSTANAPGNSAAAHNSSGFSAVPAGQFSSSLTNAGIGAFFWSTTPRNISGQPTAAWSRYLYNNRAGVNRGSLNKGYGCSVRCVRD